MPSPFYQKMMLFLNIMQRSHVRLASFTLLLHIQTFFKHKSKKSPNIFISGYAPKSMRSSFHLQPPQNYNSAEFPFRDKILMTNKIIAKHVSNSLIRWQVPRLIYTYTCKNLVDAKPKIALNKRAECSIVYTSFNTHPT